jgi:hypothetical protein
MFYFGSLCGVLLWIPCKGSRCLGGALTWIPCKGFGSFGGVLLWMPWRCFAWDPFRGFWIPWRCFAVDYLQGFWIPGKGVDPLAVLGTKGRHLFFSFQAGFDPVRQLVGRCDCQQCAMDSRLVTVMHFQLIKSTKAVPGKHWIPCKGFGSFARCWR